MNKSGNNRGRPGTPKPSIRSHGTNSMYCGSNGTKGCRCKPCTDAHAEYMLDYWKSPRTKAKRASYRRSARDRIAPIKLAAGCMDCGYNAHDVALDFDHRPGEIKLFSISTGCQRSWELILAEIAKCDVVCSNCHRIRTYERSQSEPRQAQ